MAGIHFYHFILACKYNSFKLSYHCSAEPITPQPIRQRWSRKNILGISIFRLDGGGRGFCEVNFAKSFNGYDY